MKRDADGNRIPLTVRRKPSDALVTLMLRSHMPNVYGDRSQVSVQHSGGVLVVGAPKKPDAGSPSGTRLGQIKDIDYVEIDEDMKPVERRGGYLVVGPKKDEAELEAAYGGKYVLQPVEFVEEDGSVCTEPAPAPLPREQLRADTRATTTDAPVRPLTDRQKGLPARASAAPKHPRPTAQVAVGRPADQPKPYVSPDTRAEGYGPGVVPPGGFKIV